MRVLKLFFEKVHLFSSSLSSSLLFFISSLLFSSLASSLSSSCLFSCLASSLFLSSLMSLHMSCFFSCLFSSLLSHVPSHVLLLLLSFLVSPFSSSRFFLFIFSFLLFSCLVFSFLVLSSLLLSSLLSSCLLCLSVSLCFSLSLSLCLSVCVVWCVWCLRVYVQNASVCRFKTSPCVPAPRPHVLPHAGLVPVHTETFFIGKTCYFCVHTGEGGGEEGAGVVLVNFLLSKICPRWVITCFRGSPQETFASYPLKVPDSSDHSLT